MRKMAQKNKALKNLESIFPEITEEQTAAINKLFDKQASEHAEEVENLREQLTAANNQIKEFQSMNIDEIKASAAAWQEKYAASEKAWQEKLAGLKYEAAAKDAIADIKFSSNSAKRAFLSDLQAKNLPLENDKLTGFSDFLNSYKESDPNAFISEESKPGTQYLPGSNAGVNLGNQNEMDMAQKAFAEKGIDFSSIKKFNTITNRSVN